MRIYKNPVNRNHNGNRYLYEVTMIFDGLGDYVEYASHNIRCAFSHQSDCGGRFDTWAGGTWDDAVNQARLGNPELVTSMFDGVNYLKSEISAARPVEVRDVAGEYFDVSEAISGEPECFRRLDMEENGKLVIPVIASYSVGYGITPAEIRNRGCAIIALCDELTRQGYDVRLACCCDTLGAKGEAGIKYTWYTSCINLRLDPLDIDAAAFILANPLCQRRLDFAVLERITDQKKCGRYGIPVPPRLKNLTGFVFYPPKRGMYDTLEHAKTQIMGMIASYQIGGWSVDCDINNKEEIVNA